MLLLGTMGLRGRGPRTACSWPSSGLCLCPGSGPGPWGILLLLAGTWSVHSQTSEEPKSLYFWETGRLVGSVTLKVACLFYLRTLDLPCSMAAGLHRGISLL